MSSKRCIKTNIILSESYKWLYEYSKAFDLKNPTILSVTRCKRFNDGCYGLWTVENESIHHIKISYKRHKKNFPELRNTIFHELVHAWQYEKDLPLEHDDNFWSWESIANKYDLTLRYDGDNFNEIRNEHG